MKRRHRMPFGAECRIDGTVRFRLWAPGAAQVELVFGDIRDPLKRGDDGWFELVTNAARAGTKYRFRIDDKIDVPDPASRYQPEDVNGPSEVIEPDAFEWQDEAWRGRPWQDAVIYELHVGAFTSSGKFGGVGERLDYLAELGVTAIELMPVADFPGQRSWGYDGVLPFAPDSTYGHPNDLKQLIQNAHRRGMMVLLDVVYNHFGPEGNYLGSYAPQFFTERHQTPWGKAINFDGRESRSVRDFFIHNALYWLHEYNFDGLRLDAVHAMADGSKPDVLTELAEAVANSHPPERYVHLVIENDRNQSRYLRRSADCHPRTFTAQWNDDIHHALHVILTDERESYYGDYSDGTFDQLGRCLTNGFSYQGEVSAFRKGEARGDSTEGIPLSTFISFLQNHDQIGNRAYGPRIRKIADPRAVRAAAAITVLAPSPPMLFMGEEFGADTPFLFFCDFHADLAKAVTAGRGNEFAHFYEFSDPVKREQIPDPNAATTFEASRLDWNTIAQPRHQEWLDFYKELIKLRREKIVPHLAGVCALKASYEMQQKRGLNVKWIFADGAELTLRANLTPEALQVGVIPDAPILFGTEDGHDAVRQSGVLSPWAVAWFLKE